MGHFPSGVILGPISFQPLQSFAREERMLSSEEPRIPLCCSSFPDLVTSQIPGLFFKVFILGGLSLEGRTCVGYKGIQAVGRRAEPGSSSDHERQDLN